MSDELAYLNRVFLNGSAGRPLRILSEYLQPLEALEREQIHDTVVFFGSARITEEGQMSRFYREARELAQLVSEWSAGLCCGWRRFVVCSGGGPGIMEAANRGAADAGAQTLGLNIALPFEQRPNQYLKSELSLEFHYFFMRKLWLVHLARAAVVFPGGFGTLDELFEVLTLVQTGKLEEPIPVLLYGAEFWAEVVNLHALVDYGLISAEDAERLQVVDSPQEALATLQATLDTSDPPCAVRFAPTTKPCR